MSGQLRTLKNRIRSVGNTKKITRAMEMVAASKLRRYQTMMTKGRDYAEGLENLLKRLSSGSSGMVPINHPFLEQREEKRIGLLLFTSDAGLCGSYNLDLIAKAQKFLNDVRANPRVRPDMAGQTHGSAPTVTSDAPVVIGFGKMGINALKRAGHSCEKTFSDIRASQVEQAVKNLKNYLEEIYLSGKVDAIYVIYSHFLTLSSYKPIAQKLLPLEKPEQRQNEAQADDYIFEPDQEAILKRLIPEFFESKTRQIFLESFVSEQIARMQAMHQATENATEMIDALVLRRNKVRQAAITKEIIEIVSGSQALKR